MNRSGHSIYEYHPRSAQCIRPSHCLRKQWRHNPIQHNDVTISTQRTLLQPLNITMLCPRAEPWMLCSIYMRSVVRWNCIIKCCVFFISAYVKNNDIQCQLTNWGRGRMAALFQTTFWNAFSWLKMYKFRLRFHWIMFPKVQSTIF